MEKTLRKRLFEDEDDEYFDSMHAPHGMMTKSVGTRQVTKSPRLAEELQGKPTTNKTLLPLAPSHHLLLLL